jgi:hypothetical protein
MLLTPDQIAPRKKLILAGLYLSKYDSLGLAQLGFHSFVEAFNVLGYALGGRPASIKNYRDEFDPIVSKRRKGWYKRPTRQYCLDVFEEYNNLDFETFTGLIRSFAGFDARYWNQMDVRQDRKIGESQFARRLATGLAAERYFQTIHSTLPEFQSREIEDTTRLGCGYDFLITPAQRGGPLAVEVKGLTERTGGLFITPKEYEAAGAFGKRYYLFVVKDFARVPFHEFFQDPLSSRLTFKKTERTLVQVSWSTNV